MYSGFGWCSPRTLQGSVRAFFSGGPEVFPKAQSLVSGHFGIKKKSAVTILRKQNENQRKHKSTGNMVSWGLSGYVLRNVDTPWLDVCSRVTGPGYVPENKDIVYNKSRDIMQKFGSKTILYFLRPQTPGKVSDEFT